MGSHAPFSYKMLKKVPEIIERHREESGKINVKGFMEDFHRAFGRYGGEYWTNAHEKKSRKVLVPADAPGFSEAMVADAQIYFPDSRFEEGVKAVKQAMEEGTKARTVAVGGEKPVQYIPYYQKVIEAFVKAHNELVDEFGDRLLLFALRGGMAARNAATTPIKAREVAWWFGGYRERPKVITHIGVVPDVDPFVVIRDATGDDVWRAARIIRKHLAKAGIPEMLNDLRLDDGIVSQRDVYALAHSLHHLKPLLVFRGKEFLDKLYRDEEFLRKQLPEAETYWEKIDELDKHWFGKVLRPAMKMIGLLEVEDPAAARKVLKHIEEFITRRFRIGRSTRTARRVYNRVLGAKNVVLRWKEEGTLEDKLKHDHDLRMVNELTKHGKRLYRAILHVTANDPEVKELYTVLKTALDLSRVPPDHKKRILAALAVGAARARETVGEYLQEGMGRGERGVQHMEELGFARAPRSIRILRKK